MKKTLILITALFQLFIAQISFAADSPAMKITEIKTWGSMDLVLVTTSYQGGESIDSTCNNKIWEINASDSEGKKRVFSMLLTAYTTGKNVKFWYESGDCSSLSNAQKSGVIRLVQ